MEVRQRNESVLYAKAEAIKSMIFKLHGQNRSVVLVIPPHGEDRVELLNHWEEIVLDTLREIPFPRLKGEMI